MQIAIMDFNSVEIFICTVSEIEANKLLESEDFDIGLALNYVNKKYDKHFKMSECHWIFSDDNINIEIV